MWPFKKEKQEPVVDNKKILEEQKTIGGDIIYHLTQPIKDYSIKKRKNDTDYRLDAPIENNGGMFTVHIICKVNEGYAAVAQIDVDLSKKGKELHFHRAYSDDNYFDIKQKNDFVGFIKQQLSYL